MFRPSSILRTSILRIMLVVASGAAAGGCVMTGSDSEDSQPAELVQPAASAFVLTVSGAESETVIAPGSSNLCDSTCSYAFLGGTPLTIVAGGGAPDCLTFASWDGACAGQGARCNIVINSNISTLSRWKRIPGCVPE